MFAPRIPALTLCFALGACGSTTTKTDAGADQGPPALTITIVSPETGASGVSVATPTLKAIFNRALDKPDDLQATLTKEGVTYYGLKKYSGTNLDLVFTPFNRLESRSTYTFKVAAEGAQAEVTFTTEQANEGTLAPVEGKTYDFRIKTFIYPEDLGSVFNTQLQQVPPVLMHMVSAEPTGEKDGNSLGSLFIAGSVGKVGEAPGEARVLAEDAGHPTTTSMEMKGRMEGRWFGVGPSDLHVTASGVKLVIREFYATGIFSTDGTNMDSVMLTGLIDPVELGKPLNVDLSFICTDNRFAKFCDDAGRIRVAAEIETVANPILFTTFITKPVNTATDVETGAVVEVHYSEEVDQAATTIKLTKEGGTEVPGKLTFPGKKSAVFTPDAPLAAQTVYNLEATGVAKAGGGTDTRHETFTTK